jgi:hypothetical protein
MCGWDDESRVAFRQQLDDGNSEVPPNATLS